MQKKSVSSITLLLTGFVLGTTMWLGYTYSFFSTKEITRQPSAANVLPDNQTPESFQKKAPNATTTQATAIVPTQDLSNNKTETESLATQSANTEKENNTPLLAESRKKADLLVDFLQEQGTEELGTIMTSHFNKEATDYEWSINYEHQLMDFFKTAPEFITLSPDSIECRLTKCKVVISTSNVEDMEKIAQLVVNTTYQNNRGIVKNVSYVSDNDNYALDFFFERTEEGNITINSTN